MAEKRERADVAGAMDSNTPTQSIDKKSRLEDPHVACAMEKEVAREREKVMKDKIDTQTRMDPGASLTADGGGPVLSAWVAEECNRISDRNRRRRKIARARAIFHLRRFRERADIRGRGTV